MILEVGDRIHASVGEVVPDRVLECNETVGWLEGVLEASPAVVVAFLGSRNVNWTELIRRRAVQGMADPLIPTSRPLVFHLSRQTTHPC